jgi:membrane-bound inhibitor of C-type lysozyme
VAGTILSTNYYYSYPISEGGNYFTYNSQDWESQTVTVDVIADGSGGSSLDWSNERDVANKAFGIGVTFVVDNHAVGSTEVPSGSGNYYTQGIQEGYNSFHDGSGSYYTESGGSFTNHPYGYLYLTLGNTTEVPSGSGNYYDNGYTTDYIADGNGSYISTSGSGTAYAAGTDTGLTGLDVNDTIEVPVSSGNYYNTGEKTGYTWNGSGGYNSGVSKGTRYSNGTLIWENITGSTNSVEVPSGSTIYYDSMNTGDRYTLLDNSYSPPYSYSSSWYKPNGTFIVNDGTYDYYWDGSGSFYAV